MKLTMSEVLNMMSMARQFYNELPAAARLSSDDKPLSEGERLAMSYLHGAMNLLRRRGLIRADATDEDLDLSYEIMDSLPVAEGYDSESDLDKKSTNGRKMRGPMQSGRP